MKQYLLLPVFVVLVSLTIIISSASASSVFSEVQTVANDPPAVSNTPDLESGNYCISCHLADDPRLATVTQWNGSIAREVNSVCPAATKIHQELNYTERMLLMIDRAKGSVGSLSDKTQERLDNYTQRYSRMLDTPITSLDAFTMEAQATRFQLNKIYTALNNMAEANKLRLVEMIALGITLVVLGSLAWGLYNTRSIRAGLVSKTGAIFWRVAFLLGVVVIFILPIFRVLPAEVTMTTPEQQEAQTTLDTAQRAADAADRAQARAWMLARIGTAWSELDSTQAHKVLEEAFSALTTTQEEREALWGQSLVVQEVTVGTRIKMESASLIAHQLNASRARSWGLPLVGIEWEKLDHEKATGLLNSEQTAIQDQDTIYRDLQMRSLALAWAHVDPSQSVAIATQILDPSLRTWTLRELAIQLEDASLYSPAIEAARRIADPVKQAHALEQIALASGLSDLYAEALDALEGVTGDAQAYALSDLVAASGNSALVDQIQPTYPDARASASLHLGDYQAAWDYAAQIVDPYEKARAQSAIASAWGNGDTAVQIKIPLYRDIALRDIIIQTSNAPLVDSISSAYYKVQALTELGELNSAAELADNLGDAYPLVRLAVAFSSTNREDALALVDKMSRETDKAAALQAIAIASQDASLIDQARGMALASRVSGDPLAPAQASLNFAWALMAIDNLEAQALMQQAYEATQRISIK